MAPALGALSLAGWFALWGGPAPPAAIAFWKLPTGGFYPEHALYALACLGAYFVCVEAALQWRPFWHGLSLRTGVLCAIAIAVLFALFPPLENRFVVPTMGFLDLAARAVLGTSPVKVLLFAPLAWAAVVRFRRPGLASLVAFGHVLLMAGAYLAWDKYALLPLAALWWLHAVDEVPTSSDFVRRGPGGSFPGLAPPGSDLREPDHPGKLPTGSNTAR
jgi:hypothetical protein